MLFRNYFNFVLLTSLLSIFQIAIASDVETKCSENIFQVKIYNGSNLAEMRYELYYKINEKQSKLIYKTESGVFFHIACIQNKNKNDQILFQEYCYGNACSENTYGVFDPNTKNMLIKPADWPKGNSKEVERLIGYPPPFLVDDKRSFCCEINTDQDVSP